MTGAHAFKVGFNDGWGVAGPNRAYSLQPVSYRFNNGVPNQISLFATPYASTTDVDADLGVYAQDRWTLLDRLTLTLGLRYDYFADSFPEQTVGPARWRRRATSRSRPSTTSLARHHAQVRRRLRPLRRRTDRAQGQLL